MRAPANCHLPYASMALVTRTKHSFLDVPNHLLLIDEETETLRG